MTLAGAEYPLEKRHTPFQNWAAGLQGGIAEAGKKSEVQSISNKVRGLGKANPKSIPGSGTQKEPINKKRRVEEGK